MKWSKFKRLVVAGTGAVAAVVAFACCGAPEANGPLRPEAYVWQRLWNAPVCEAVAGHGAAFSNLVVLAAEVSWKQKQPQVVRVPVDYPLLTGGLWEGDRAAQLRVPTTGLALRIGPFSGPFATNDSVAAFLVELASSLVAEARSNHLSLSELQIDFDCAESKLDGYRLWVEAMRRRIVPIPLTITALPSWLGQPAFARLVGATDGYVLQVHSLERPTDINEPFTLCDPAAARLAVERAGKFGVPFRVALPTYGYVIAFDRAGRFVGLSAEGPNQNWPADLRLGEVRADPLALAQLVQAWATNRPVAMFGVIWYRLPTIVDNFNWRWPTLSAMIAPHSPRESLRVESCRVESGLVEISLVNDGEIDISSRVVLEVHWLNARMAAGDGLRDFELLDAGVSSAKFRTRSEHSRLPAGESRVVGWLRFDQDCEVRCEIKKP